MGCTHFCCIYPSSATHHTHCAFRHTTTPRTAPRATRTLARAYTTPYRTLPHHTPLHTRVRALTHHTTRHTARCCAPVPRSSRLPAPVPCRFAYPTFPDTPQRCLPCTSISSPLLAVACHCLLPSSSSNCGDTSVAATRPFRAAFRHLLADRRALPRATAHLLHSRVFDTTNAISIYHLTTFYRPCRRAALPFSASPTPDMRRSTLPPAA